MKWWLVMTAHLAMVTTAAPLPSTSRAQVRCSAHIVAFPVVMW